MNRMIARFERLSRRSVFFIGLVLVLVIGILDYVTGYYLAFYPFYLLPLTFVVWFGGLTRGLVLSFVNAAVWLAADYLARLYYPNLLVPIWNFVIRFVIFSIMAYLLWNIKLFQERSRELSEFIIHDLRVPLAHISLGISNILDIESKGLTIEQNEILHSCQHSTSRMFNLINSILDLSRLERKKLKVTISEVSLDKLLAEALEEVAAAAKSKKIAIQKNISVDNKHLSTDYELICRVLVNLLINAIKAGPNNSIVTISVTKAKDAEITFSVTDSGPGIPPAMINTIFDKFVQVDARKAGVITSGSGLGLPFCKLAVEELGGSIWLKSEEGKGTQAQFTLPITGRLAKRRTHA